MRVSNSLAVAAIVLSIIAVLLSVGAILALMDIARGEELNLTLEWAAVWAAVIVMIIAHVVSIAAIFSLLLRRRPREKRNGPAV